jgi:hypothetical protein
VECAIISQVCDRGRGVPRWNWGTWVVVTASLVVYFVLLDLSKIGIL